MDALLSPLARFKLINFYPPMIGAGIRVKDIDPAFTRITVEMKLRWWNKNVFGTQFGGALYMMCDPFFVAILMTNLGKDYIEPMLAVRPKVTYWLNHVGDREGVKRGMTIPQT